jgi:ribosomal protein L29
MNSNEELQRKIDDLKALETNLRQQLTDIEVNNKAS